MLVAPIQQSISYDRKHIKEDDITCYLTLKGFGLASLDALCCLTFCCFCGGLCGKYPPYISYIDDTYKELNPGQERCLTTCAVDCAAATILPITCCGCFFGCCGTCVPCVKLLFKCANKT